MSGTGRKVSLVTMFSGGRGAAFARAYDHCSGGAALLGAFRHSCTSRLGFGCRRIRFCCLNLTERSALISVDCVRRALLAACLAPISSAQAQSLALLVARSKRSIVAVGSFSALRSPRFSFSGTGFVIGDGTVVVTCLHVLPELLASTERIELSVQWRGEHGDFEWRPAKVLSRDRARDLCLLRVEGPALPALPLTVQEAADSAEGTSVALLGYPLGGALGFNVVTHRGIISSRVSSTAPAPSAGSLSDRAVLSARAGAFDLLQLDAIAYPGNSGGPLINLDTGAVVGVVSMVLVKGTRESALSSPTGITYAVPAKYVSTMVAQL